MDAVWKLALSLQLAVQKLQCVANQTRLAPFYVVAHTTVAVENHEGMARIATTMAAPLNMIHAVKPKAATVEQALALDGRKWWARILGHWAQTIIDNFAIYPERIRITQQILSV